MRHLFTHVRGRFAALAFAACLTLTSPLTAGAHSERETPSPPRPGAVPDAGRAPTAILTVCKGGGCNFEHIQAAVDAAPAGAKVRVHRGLYREEPSRAQPDLPPDNPDGTYSFAFHQAHPNAQNLIAVLGGSTGKTNLTIEGWDERKSTLADPRDVVIDVGFAKHVGIRADKADGFIVRNLSVYHAREHNLYVLDQDGFITDRTVSGWAGDYDYLTFAVDHGVQSYCEAFGSGDGGIYPGGSADLTGTARALAGDWSVEISHCSSHHNVLGYSGTQGDFVYVHDTEFFDNAVGLTSDSETDHPNYPENNLRLENNRFYDNNFDVYRDDADITITVFFGEFYLPVGTGVFLASGNLNRTAGNWFFDNSTVGHWLASGQGIVLGPISDPPAAPFMSSCNAIVDNRAYAPPDFLGSCATADCRNGYDTDAASGLDFDWDGLGLNNCWQGNVREAGPAVHGFVPGACTPIVDPTTQCDTSGAIGEPLSGLLDQGGLLYVPDPSDPEEAKPICFFTGSQPCFKDPSQRIGNRDARNRAGGFVPADDPRSQLFATGTGSVASPAGPVAFSFNARRNASSATGSFRVTRTGLDVKGSVRGLHRDAWTATLDGPCTYNGAPATCRIVGFDREFTDATTPPVAVAKAPPPLADDTFSLSVTPQVGGKVLVETTLLGSGEITLSH